MKTLTDTPAAAAGQWDLGDLRVNRLGFGAMRLMSGNPAHLTENVAAAGLTLSESELTQLNTIGTNA
jgi:aryl-alcohol dehydrogenase-like predicted oxidoreductase